MYEPLIAALRKVDEYDSGYAKLMYDAANAIEELQQIADHYEETAKDYFKDVCYYLEREPKWIPVTERLPEENGRYLVRYVRDIDLEDGSVHSDEVRIMRFVDAQWRFPFICTSYVRKMVTMEKVTHWMPLPEPPKEE